MSASTDDGGTPDARNVGQTEWQRLYKAGSVAALLAALIFRRNLGPEVSLFVSRQQPATVDGWYSLLQARPLLGLLYLDFFDVVNCVLVGLVFLALFAALRPIDRSLSLVGVAAGLAGVVVCITSNSALTMLSLSVEYTSATTNAERSVLLAAGRATLASNDPSAPYASTGHVWRYFLLAVGVSTFSVAMRRSGDFSNVTAAIGMLAAIFDLAYVGSFAFVAGVAIYLLPVAGLSLVLWQILVGVRLYRLGTRNSGGGKSPRSNQN
ncbi:hypothetical protein [Halosimplex sp. J119]